jgi:hypothetical protein
MKGYEIDTAYEEEDGPLINKKNLPMPSNLVLPLAKRTPPPTVDAPAWLVQREPMNLAAGWTSFEGAQEHTSAMDRAKALRVRLVPFLWGWFGLSFVLGVVVLLVVKDAPSAGLATILLFSALTAATYVKLNGQDYAHSREGTERHKVDTAADLAKMQMKQDHELRKMALDSYVRQLTDRER